MKMKHEKLLELIKQYQGYGYQLYSGIYSPVVRLTKGNLYEGNFVDLSYSTEQDKITVRSSLFAEV